MHSRKRVLVTGGAGFLGSHLCERLLAEGDEVICADITFPLFAEVDEIYNLACPASPIHYQFDPVQTITTLEEGLRNTIEYFARVLDSAG